MNLGLISSNSFWLYALAFATGAIAFYALIATLVLLAKHNPRKNVIIAALVLVVAAVVCVVSFVNAVNEDTQATSHNDQSLQQQANAVYNLKLSINQADYLLDGANSNDSDTQEYGTTLIDKSGGQVEKVQLVQINSNWLIIDAGTRSELPHA